MKRWLYLVHRWLGIALAVVMALWFLSGVVMMYVGYPKLTTAERVAGARPLPADACCAGGDALRDALGDTRHDLARDLRRNDHADAGREPVGLDDDRE